VSRMVDTGGSHGLVTAEIDLNARTFERWLSVGAMESGRTYFPKSAAARLTEDW
jgi:hypothetical protein